LKAGEKDRGKAHPFFETDGVVPLYIQLKNELKKRLLSAPELHRLPGTLELAAEYRVSKGTVNRALALLVDENLICRIPHRGTLRSSSQDYADPQLNSRVFALVFPADGYQSWKEMIIPMQNTAVQAGFSLDIYLYSNAPGHLQRVLARARKQCVGIALYLITEDRNTIAGFQEQYPVVIIGQKFEGLPVSSVTADNHTAARQITSYFLSMGMHSVAMAFGTVREAAFVRKRQEGWQDAHREYGLVPDENRIFSPQDAAFTGFDEFLRRSKPDALILSNNGQDWLTIIRIIEKCRYPMPRLAAFVLQRGGDRSFFEKDTVFAELPVAEMGEAVIRLLLLTLQKAVRTPQKLEIGMKIYTKQGDFLDPTVTKKGL
jgi:DNA-binding LacI/PurR family transcriptional regulator